MNKDLVVRALAEENGINHVAWVCFQAFSKNPDEVAVEMRTIIPADRLPDVVFRMATDYILDGIHHSDETPQARKKVAERTATMQRLFAEELKEGGRRAHDRIRREMFPR